MLKHECIMHVKQPGCI